MFEIGWTEMLVIAIVMIVVVGPKDLPKMLRTFGKTTAKLRAMAGDFQKQFNEALKEAELDDLKKSVDELRGLNPTAEIKRQLNPFEKAAADVRSGLDQAMKPKPSTSSEPAASSAHVAEPLKEGLTAIPGGPDAMPAATPVFPVMTDASVTSAEAVPVEAAKPKKAKKPATPAVTQSSVAAAMAGISKPRPVQAAEPVAVATAEPSSQPGRAAATKPAKPSPTEKIPAAMAVAAKPSKPVPAKAVAVATPTPTASSATKPARPTKVAVAIAPAPKPAAAKKTVAAETSAPAKTRSAPAKKTGTPK